MDIRSPAPHITAGTDRETQMQVYISCCTWNISNDGAVQFL